MSLQDTLNALKEELESALPPEIRTMMHKATDELAHSGIMEKVIQPGSTMPEFILPDERGNAVSSTALLQRGPLVVSFYRGVW